MSHRPTSSDALAEVLRSESPALDELARARIERRLIQARSAPAPRAGLLRRRGRGLALAAVAIAAAAALFVLGDHAPDAPPVARFERREIDSAVERGTLAEGSTLRTSAGEVADLSVAGSRVRVGEASRLRLVTLDAERVALELHEGVVRVAFHPRRPGREQLTVETPSARVEVVGTVFEVTVRDGTTTVAVTEGTVRVVPTDGSATRLVHAGQEARVGGVLAQARAQLSEVAEARAARALAAREVVERELGEPSADEATIEEETEPREPSPAARADDSAARLSEARALVHAGRSAPAAVILHRLVRAPTPAPVRAEAWTLLADIHRSAGRLAEERDAYEQAAAAGRGRPVGHNALFSLARLQERRFGDRLAARATYERYLVEAPDGPLARQAQEALCRLGSAERCQGGP